MSRNLLAGICLTALTAVVYFQTHQFAFVGFDDPQLIAENVHVRQGVTTEGLKWAFFSAWRENVFFYPLSLLSHMVDVTWFGLDAGRHHLTSVAIHAAAVLALFVLLAQLTGAFWRPALAAGLFAVHPLGVDSVAWVAERSNVLCALLVFTTMSAYVQYAISRKKQWYYLSLGLFGLALLAKPTAVMVPPGLLLIHRQVLPPNPGNTNRNRSVYTTLLPFVLLAVIRLLAVLAAERGTSPVGPSEAISAGMLTANALVAVASYLQKIVFPFRLSVYYPFPEVIPLWQAVISGGVLLLITVMIIKFRRRRPMVQLGWLWYLLFLAPSMGVVRSGPWPAMADHYVYIPSAGLFIILAWMIPVRAVRSFRARAAVSGAGIFLLIFFVAVSFVHVGHYRDSITLFSRAVSVNQQNFLAYIGLGNAYQKQGKTALAETKFREAIAIKPESPGAHNNLALLLTKKEAWAEAESHFKIALALSPGFSMARYNLTNLYLKKHSLAEGLKLQGNPDTAVTKVE